MDSDSEDVWSDTSDEDEAKQSVPLQSRAYQIEMFEHTMKGNIIAVMGTGSGKTQVAKLRIEAELQRSSTKRVWFTAPSVVLAYQQHSFLSRQLPAFQFRLITGMDNAEFWDTQEVWDKALHNVHAVICTPAILLQALNAGFVTMKGISLLVVDEAHHCVARSAPNATMRLHYHPFKKSESGHELPHILGLSASPITKKSSAEISELEANLDAKCKVPMQQLEEYTAFVNMPRVETLTFSEQPLPDPQLLISLVRIVSELQIADDPIVKMLRERDNFKSREKLEKIMQKNATPAMIELQSLLRSATTIHQVLGCWPCSAYIKACVRKLHAAVFSDTGLHLGADLPHHDSRLYMDASLNALQDQLAVDNTDVSEPENLSPKVIVLLKFLKKEFRESLRGLIFVESRNAAWALTEIINTHPATRNYKAFSFVGVSNPAYHGNFDLAQLHVQNENLERFRRGELNLCVATAVLEEGVDVPAMNLVVCFDERRNLRSFVQSRGRARQQSSKFVILRSELDLESKVKKWQALEAVMKEECEVSMRELEERQLIEGMNETGGTVFRVQATGATLTFDNARQSLQRFCSKLLAKAESEQTDPVFCIHGGIGVDVSAKVYLPSSLPPNLQVAYSNSCWRTGKMAKRDAAFQAYLGLYKAGLVSENLQPRDDMGEDAEAGTADDTCAEKRESTYAVRPQYNPWPSVMESWAKANHLYAHRLQVRDVSDSKPAMVLLMPIRLSGTKFPLYTTQLECLQVSLSGGKEVHGYTLGMAQDINLTLLSTVLGRRLGGFRKEEFPFLLVPGIEKQSLKAWYDSVSISRTLTDSHLHGDGQEYLVLLGKENVPYVYRPQGIQVSAGSSCNGDVPEIVATKLSRRLEFLSPPTALTAVGPPLLRSLPVSECTVLGVPVSYARFMLLVPSITFMLEVSLRSTAACQGPLAGLAFRDIDMVSEALTLPRVGGRNYQRLEFLGDDLLKFYATIQVFVDHPDHPENLLTMARGRIVSNARLQRATRTLGLDQFLTQHRFSGSGWTAGVARESVAPSEPPVKTHLSSKILADVVEALIGAASLDTPTRTPTGSHCGENVIRALQLFVDEVPWRSLSENLDRIPVLDDSAINGIELLKPVESLLGYTFTHRALLTEALTQSWLGGQVSSYDRLEFLGDAVLDHIVKTRLFHSPLKLDPDQMTLRRHALVSHATLAFFAFQASYTCSAFEVCTDPFTRKTVVDRESTRVVFLFDHIRRVGNRKDPEHREATLAAYHAVRDRILHAFQHGRKHPWTELCHIGAPKMYSDVIESVLGAVFIDSRGDLGICARFLGTIGFMDLVERFATVPPADLDVRHPEGILSQVQPGCKLMARQSKRTGRSWKCKVMADGERIAHAKSASCKDEAQCRAAERAVEVLSKKRRREDVAEENEPMVMAA